MTDRLIPSETPIATTGVSRAKRASPRSCRRVSATAASTLKRLVLRGATVIDGTGAPPIGADPYVVENNRITVLKKFTQSANAANRPAAGDHEIVAAQWVTPRFIDCHAHPASPTRANAGVRPSTVSTNSGWRTAYHRARDGSMNAWVMLDQKKRSAENSIAAPRCLPTRYSRGNDML